MSKLTNALKLATVVVAQVMTATGNDYNLDVGNATKTDNKKGLPGQPR